MDKRFDPASYEQKWQAFWRELGCFRARTGGGRPSFCIMIPPPNVTGRLHVGHALQSTLQDVLTRWRRMQGANALWLPGTDHAGIATQLMVERQLAKEGTSRLELGRERFLERMWQWKGQFHGNIREQQDMLGASCDWSRERFTLDEGLSRAVREAFVRLFREGLISRGEYIVNWSPALDTAVSDLEVEMKEVKGHLYHLAYPIEGSDETIVVATTRPETMLGDTAVAFHPEDERYRHLAGRFAVLPLVGRRLRLVADGAVDPAFGTGLVKVTPFHDPHDFRMGQRHGLELVQVIDRHGRMTAAAGPDFAGLDRFEARQKVVTRLREVGALVKVVDHVHNVGHSQRSGEPIEPLVSTQWFCDVSGMAKQALEAVERGELELMPETWAKTWSHWLANIEPWCISRQLWWGHRIPAWYTKDGRTVVAHDAEEAAAEAGTSELEQDPDVLDTWFSSALWPFSTLGWPEATEDLRTFYPTNVLVTGYDILFFWVARMVMTGLHFTGELPFKTVHLTGLVRDAHGQKMSKTKGNAVDPADLVAEYGADALRFTLAALDSPGRDVPLDPDRLAGYRAFGNKIWNATRFVLARVGEAKVQAELDPRSLSAAELAAPERWILSRLAATAAEVDSRLENFRFDEACHHLYHFFWGELCDWYVELSKPALSGDAPRPHVGEVLATVLDRSLRLLHPVMPFLTEELWQRLPGRELIHEATIALAPYPRPEPGWRDPEVERMMAAFTEVVTRLRALRLEAGVPATDKVRLHLRSEVPGLEAFFEAQAPLAGFLCRLEGLTIGPPPVGAPRDLVAGVELAIVAPDKALDPAQRQRLEKDEAKLGEEIARAEARLVDPSFLGKAPPTVVEQSRQRLAEMRERLLGLEQRLRR